MIVWDHYPLDGIVYYANLLRGRRRMNHNSQYNVHNTNQYVHCYKREYIIAGERERSQHNHHDTYVHTRHSSQHNSHKKVVVERVCAMSNEENNFNTIFL